MTGADIAARVNAVPAPDRFAASAVAGIVDELVVGVRAGELFADVTDHDVDRTIAEHLAITGPDSVLASRSTVHGVDIRNVDRRDVWVDRAGVAHPIAAMGGPERAGIVELCRLHAPRWWTAAAVNELHDTTLAAALARIAFGVPFVAELAPDEWIESTPLLRALAACDESAAADRAG